MVLRFDGSVTMYMNIGDPRAHVWEGYWKEDEGNLFLLDSFRKPLTIGFPTARYEIRMRIFNEMHYFHKTGDEQGNGNL
jgi:hypothetical protein